MATNDETKNFHEVLEQELETLECLRKKDGLIQELDIVEYHYTKNEQNEELDMLMYHLDKDVQSNETNMKECLHKLEDKSDKNTQENKSENDHNSIYQCAYDANLAGLALSGGGIRSATFNLGVIQALARKGILSKFDYLSTVSGGGYIGGWLSALLHRKTTKKDNKDNEVVDEEFVEEFQSELKTHPKSEGGEINAGFDPVEHKSIRHLRGYSNYISPRLGLSGDMLATISIVLRNIIVIQLVLISLLMIVFLLGHLIIAVSSINIPDKLNAEWLLLVSILLLILAVFNGGRLITKRETNNEKYDEHDKSLHITLSIVLQVILPITFAGLMFSVVSVDKYGNEYLKDIVEWKWAISGSFVYSIAWLFGYSRAWLINYKTARKEKKEEENKKIKDLLIQLFSTIIAGALLGLLLFTAFDFVKYDKIDPSIDMVYAAFHSLKYEQFLVGIDILYVIAFGPTLFLLGLSLIVTLHIFIARDSFSEQDREWLARLGGFVLLTALLWSLVFGLILYSTPFVKWLTGVELAALVTWISGSGVGAWLGSSAETSDSWKKELIIRIMPWLFIAGLALIIAHLTHVMLLNFATETEYLTNADPLQQIHGFLLEKTFYVSLVIAILIVLIIWRFDINLFSLHTMYANRLTRAYLGASNENRKANPFQGFDKNDDLDFHALNNQRPIPIINTSINMTGGDDLAWHTRRAASFSITPCWSGYQTLRSKGKQIGAYRPTENYARGLSLGTWMAVSGASASPNMGYHTSTAVAALMTAFNLRLGRWCGNPAGDESTDKNVWKYARPLFLSIKPILCELTGSANGRADWVNLTDGGHFENLGVYELIRRRCRLIVVVDAGCDSKYHFEDLANLLIKCWTDFGVHIHFDEKKFEYLHQKKDSRYCRANGIIGDIEYDKKNNVYGQLIYLKSSMTGDEWPDIRHYADMHEDFPHETTADQFFDENQFEAYRHLGFKIATEMVKTLENELGQEPQKVSVKNIMEKIKKKSLLINETENNV